MEENLNELNMAGIRGLEEGLGEALALIRVIL